MKKLVILAVAALALAILGKQFLTQTQEGADNMDQTAKTEAPKVEKKAPKSDFEQKVSAVLADAKKDGDVKDEINDEITAMIEDSLNGNRNDELSAALEKIKTVFPHLKQEINEYQSDVATQKIEVSNYKDLVAERNEYIKTGQVPAGLKAQLEQRREDLLAESKLLGQRAVEINRAIRDAAASYSPNS